jgi:SAM-dependent methyltransferase
MLLTDIVQRPTRPAPWSEGDNIPWNDPDFSARMLKEHFPQAHDAASRRATIIARHVAWIHETLLEGAATRILDLGCGPGLYVSALARQGHTCVGVDFSPASMAYARSVAERDGLTCDYRHADIRQADYGSGYGLAMLIYGEFNVFRPADARLILQKAQRALAPGGLLLLEPHPFAVIQRYGTVPATWYASASGLFSERPHLCLKESWWDDATHTTTTRYMIVDAATAAVTRYAQSYQAYTDDEYRTVLVESGFVEVRFYTALAPSVDDAPDAATHDLIAITARKPSI